MSLYSRCMHGVEALLTIPFFIVGAAIGTFLTTCIERLPFQEDEPEEEDPPNWYYKIPLFSMFIALPLYTRFSSLLPAARCPACKHRLALTERLPILSFLFQQGRCKHCGYKIPGRHLIVETLTGLLFALAFYLFGLGPRLLIALIFVPLFMVASVVDFRFHIIPDEVSATGIITGLGWSALWTAYHAGEFFYHNRQAPLDIIFFRGVIDPQYALGWAMSGFLVGAGTLWLFHLLGSAYAGTDAMGFGDVKLAAFIGLFLGPRQVFITLVWSMLLGATAGVFIKLSGGGRSHGGYTAFAFGPYICAGALLTLYFGTEGPIGNYVQNMAYTFQIIATGQ